MMGWGWHAVLIHAGVIRPSGDLLKAVLRMLTPRQLANHVTRDHGVDMEKDASKIKLINKIILLARQGGHPRMLFTWTRVCKHLARHELDELLGRLPGDQPPRPASKAALIELLAKACSVPDGIETGRDASSADRARRCRLVGRFARRARNAAGRSGAQAAVLPEPKSQGAPGPSAIHAGRLNVIERKQIKKAAKARGERLNHDV
jgi:hypothetical protein